MVCDGSLVILRGVYVVCDPRVLVAAVEVAARLLRVVQELPGKQRLHLQYSKGTVSKALSTFSSADSFYELNSE